VNVAGTGPLVQTTLSRTAAELPSPGTVTAAPLAPKSGPIDVEAGTPVVVVAVSFWESKTIQAARNLIVGALGVGGLAIAAKVIANGGIIGLDWSGVLNIAINATLLSLAGGYMAWWKSRENNAVK
jgi:hypothetical protein